MRRELKTGWFRSGGSARSAALRRMLGRWRDAIGVRRGGRVVALVDGWISGLARWRCMRKRQIVKLIGRIWERRMKGCIVFVSNLLVVAKCQLLAIYLFEPTLGLVGVGYNVPFLPIQIFHHHVPRIAS
jgi:hypothetical protein